MKGHIKYLIYVIKHKWFVFLECAKCGLWFRGIIHDWDKLLPSMFMAYSKHFYKPDGSSVKIRDNTGYYKPTDTGDEAFDLAWLGHARRSRHHWQWWCVVDKDGPHAYKMGLRDVLEMVCDWYGAARAQKVTGSVGAWWEKNSKSMILHDWSIIMVETELRRRGEFIPQTIETKHRKRK